jgi:hypothetical protein
VSVNFQQSARHYVLEDRNVSCNECEFAVCSCEVWSLTSPREQIEGFESDPEERMWKGDEEELRSFFSSRTTIRMIKSRRMERAEHVECMGDFRKFFIGRFEGKRLLGRHTRRF